MTQQPYLCVTRSRQATGGLPHTIRGSKSGLSLRSEASNRMYVHVLCMCSPQQHQHQHHRQRPPHASLVHDECVHERTDWHRHVAGQLAGRRIPDGFTTHDEIAMSSECCPQLVLVKLSVRFVASIDFNQSEKRWRFFVAKSNYQRAS